MGMRTDFSNFERYVPAELSKRLKDPKFKVTQKEADFLIGKFSSRISDGRDSLKMRFEAKEIDQRTYEKENDKLDGLTSKFTDFIQKKIKSQ
jgi:hypothetical protein